MESAVSFAPLRPVNFHRAVGGRILSFLLFLKTFHIQGILSFLLFYTPSEIKGCCRFFCFFTFLDWCWVRSPLSWAPQTRSQVWEVCPLKLYHPDNPPWPWRTKAGQGPVDIKGLADAILLGAVALVKRVSGTLTRGSNRSHRINTTVFLAYLEYTYVRKTIGTRIFHKQSIHYWLRPIALHWWG